MELVSYEKLHLDTIRSLCINHMCTNLLHLFWLLVTFKTSFGGSWYITYILFSMGPQHHFLWMYKLVSAYCMLLSIKLSWYLGLVLLFSSFWIPLVLRLYIRCLNRVRIAIYPLKIFCWMEFWSNMVLCTDCQSMKGVCNVFGNSYERWYGGSLVI